MKQLEWEEKAVEISTALMHCLDGSLESKDIQGNASQRNLAHF